MNLSRARWCALGVALLSVAPQHPGSFAGQRSLQDPWTVVAPSRMVRTGSLAHPRLAEVSGAAVSNLHPSMIWVITDSGNDPELFGVDSTGRLKAIVSLSGATNIDWEDLAMGRCGTLTCLYIADTGDNFANRQDVVIYRVPEPNLTPQVTGIAELRVDGVEALRIRYPDGPRDVEAMGVTAAGDVILVSKGRDGAVVAYHVPSAAWDDHSAMARQLDTLPIRPSNAGGRLVTGMAIAPDGRVAVRTYRDIYHFQLTDKLQFDAGKRRVACDILGFEPLGEAIAWRGNDLWLLGERGLFKAGAVFITTCGARVSSSYRNK